MSNWWPLLFKTELKNISQILLCFFLRIFYYSYNIQVSPTVYSHLNNFTGKLIFSYFSKPTQLRISKPSYEHSCGSPSCPIKIWGKSVQWFVSYDRTNKQTEIKTYNLHKKTLCLYMYVSYNRLNGWTDSAEIFWGSSKIPRETPGSSVSTQYTSRKCWETIWTKVKILI